MRARIAWNDARTEHIMDSGRVAKQFRCPLLAHPVITSVVAFEVASSTQEVLTILVDPRPEEEPTSVSNIDPGDPHELLSTKDQYVLVVDSSDTFKDTDVYTAEVNNTIVLRKSTGAQWQIVFTYELVAGPLQWIDEFAELRSKLRVLGRNQGTFNFVGPWRSIRIGE